MIKGFLATQEIIRNRTIAIGRELVICKHFATVGKMTRVAAPYITSLNSNSVTIVVGMDEFGENVAITIPAVMYNDGCSLSVKQFVEAANVEISNEQIESAVSDKRGQELAIMKELMSKYPNEAALLS